MAARKPARHDTLAVERIVTPRDYFADTRTGLNLWPEKILCFTRKSPHEADAEPLARHHHHRYVLVAAWKEAGDIYVDQRRFTLRESDILLIFPFQLHHGFKFHQARVLWQFTTFEMKDGAALETLRLNPQRQAAPADLGLLSHLARIWNDPRAQDELAPWLALILSRLLRARSARKERQSSEIQMSNSFLMKVNQHCLAHLHQPLRLKEFGAKLSISESHLRSRFRQVTGMSLGQHLRRLRMQKAMGMLAQSDLSVTEIAERCGFDSIFSFSRSFRHFTGITAREYRLNLA